MTTPTVNTSQTWSRFLELDDVKEYLQFPDDATNAQDSVLERVVDMACEWMQNYINRPIGPTTFVERYDGWGGEYIMLNHYPVISVTSIKEWQSSGGNIDLTESTPSNPVDGFQLNPETGRIMRAFNGYSWPRPFFPGSRNIEVTYVAGYNPVPPVLWMAAVELIAYWWRNTQQASRMVVNSTGYDPVVPATDDLWAGVPYRITSLIEPYRRVVIG